MQKTISDMAKFIKDIIPANIPDSYSIKAMFKQISNEEDIKSSVLAFRNFLYLICDKLIADGSKFDKEVKAKESNDSHPSLPVSFPFINNVKSILFNIGYHGELSENKEMIIADLKLLSSTIGVNGEQMKAKISVPKLLEALKFLTTCGINFDGIDLDIKSLDLEKNVSLKITYPNNPVMLTGLKVMALAQKELHSKGNHDIFLRCDYRVLKEEKTDVESILKDFITPLSSSVQDFILKLHNRYLDEGLTCTVDIFYLNIRFIYSRKNKEVYTISAAHESGYRLLIKAQYTDKYSELIKTFPLHLQEKIARGYGCNKKIFGEPCQKGCHGYSFPLDESIIEISNNIEQWLDMEVSCLQSKKSKTK